MKIRFHRFRSVILAITIVRFLGEDKFPGLFLVNFKQILHLDLGLPSFALNEDGCIKFNGLTPLFPPLVNLYGSK